MTQLHFTCYETPVPQGSLKAFVSRGKVRVKSDNPKLAVYRQLVAGAAAAEINRREREWIIGRAKEFLHQGIAIQYSGPVFPKSYPVSVMLNFYLQGPIKMPKARRAHTTKPDLDKLVR